MIARLVHSLALCWAVASAAMPALLAVADATGDGAVIVDAGHVEAPGSGACPIPHDAHCQVCSLLRHHAAVPDVGAPLAELSHRGSAVPPSWPAAKHAPGLFSGGPRAPPVD